MIPLQLTLYNFLSYQQATLAFQGLHTACICGPNGSGKSSLLEAIAWALWGQSRAASEDDVLHTGTSEARVDFIFQMHQHVYRVIRSRQRGQATALEFQIALDDQGDPSLDTAEQQHPALPFTFRTLTVKGLRATQQLILEQLKLDYDTFVNSAYLRQGRADEFMLKRPGERKQILATLLKLDQYDGLAERSRDLARHHRATVDVLIQQRHTLEQTLQDDEAIAQEKATLEHTLTILQQEQTADDEQWQWLQARQQQGQQWQQQLEWLQQQQQGLRQGDAQLQQQYSAAQQHYAQLETLLQQAEMIQVAYQQFQGLQADNDTLTATFHGHQAAWEQRQTLLQEHSQLTGTLYDRLHRLETQLETLEQHQQELNHTLAKAPAIDEALTKLHQARAWLSHLDDLHDKVTPLLQRQQQLQGQLDLTHARLSARLEELQATAQRYHDRQQDQGQLQSTIQEVKDQLAHLDDRKHYQEQLREKGLERRRFMDRLQDQQREYEAQLAALDQKIQLLKQPDALCPLCDRPLEQHHWELIEQKHRSAQAELQDQLWVLREQLVTSEREIQVLRREYRDVERELSAYATMLERHGQLQQQLQSSADWHLQWQHLQTEQLTLTQTLQQQAYAPDLYQELQQVHHQVTTLYTHCSPYNEKDHALARGEVERWRWAELKQAELKQAQLRLQQLESQKPELEAEIAHVHRDLTQVNTSPLQQQIDALQRYLTELGYDRAHHDTVRSSLRQAQPWQLRYQELCQAQQQAPEIQQQLATISQARQQHQTAIQDLTQQIDHLTQQLEELNGDEERRLTLAQQRQQRRTQMDATISQLGRVQQQQQHLAALRLQYTALCTQIQATQRQHRIHQELAKAFGKNGIQALLIETILPQLEADTNQILSRLSANQLHVQFVTQRAKKTKSRRDAGELIETLEIYIADTQGTRPYETYSGGEAFRVNFAIRLALSCLLAQRSGTALQLLIVDEGFGSQDAAGCERLVAAIQAISPDFACILMVTHIPQFRDAFQTHIDVYKTEAGSQLRLSV